jgi:hypothetical protein
MPTKKGNTRRKGKPLSRGSKPRRPDRINPDVSIKDVADKAAVPIDTVRDILNEGAGPKIPIVIQDQVFGVARQLGYDFRKLKIGKRMRSRRDTLVEVLGQCRLHHEWTIVDVISYLEKNLEMLDRVRKKVFPNEFDQPWL